MTQIKHISGSAGGYLVGNSHKNGGIQAINKSIGKPLEMEGGEVVITKPAVEDNELREFEGQMLTNREILSKINESGGGVSFAEKGAELPTQMHCYGNEFKFGGETLTDYEITHRISKCGCQHNEFHDGGDLSQEMKKGNITVDQSDLQQIQETADELLIPNQIDIENIEVGTVDGGNVLFANGGYLPTDIPQKLRDDITFLVDLQSKKQHKLPSGGWDINLFKSSLTNKIKKLPKNEATVVLDYLTALEEKAEVSPIFTKNHKIWENYENNSNLDKDIDVKNLNKNTLNYLWKNHKIKDVEERLINVVIERFPELLVSEIIDLSDKIALYDNKKRDAQTTAEAIQYLTQDFTNFDRKTSLASKENIKRLEELGIIDKLSDTHEFSIPEGGNYQFKNKFGSFTSVKVMLVDTSLRPSTEYFSLAITVRKLTSNNRTIIQSKPLITLPIKDYKAYMTDLKNKVNQGTENFEKVIEKRNSKYKVGDFVTYINGDLDKEIWIGQIAKVLDFGNEYAYRINAYHTNFIDAPMFDSEKTNEKYEVQLKPSSENSFKMVKKLYDASKGKTTSINDVNEIIELTISADNNLSKQLIELTGSQWNSIDFENIEPTESGVLSSTKPFRHKATGKQFLIVKSNFPSDTKKYNVSDYNNPYEVNRAIEKLLDGVYNNEDFSISEKEFISNYSGYGGLEKMGSFSDNELKGLLYEYFTPDEIVKKMWALAYKFGFGIINNPMILEPSVGTGNFFKYAPVDATLFGNEINPYSKRVCEILYPTANISLQPFEKNFILKNLSIKNKLTNLQKYDLVIGNPPYGQANSKYISMGEGDYTKARNFTEYFITRGLDLLKSGGLLIYVVGAEQYNGGTLFLDSGVSEVKKKISEKAQFLDAYRLPTKIFERTGVASEILVFKKQ